MDVICRKKKNPFFLISRWWIHCVQIKLYCTWSVNVRKRTPKNNHEQTCETQWVAAFYIIKSDIFIYFRAVLFSIYTLYCQPLHSFLCYSVCVSLQLKTSWLSLPLKKAQKSWWLWNPSFFSSEDAIFNLNCSNCLHTASQHQVIIMPIHPCP